MWVHWTIHRLLTCQKRLYLVSTSQWRGMGLKTLKFKIYFFDNLKTKGGGGLTQSISRAKGTLYS